MALVPVVACGPIRGSGPVVYRHAATVVQPSRPHSSSAVDDLAARVRHALRGSRTAHVDYLVRVTGLGTFGAGRDRSTAPASNEKLLTAMTVLSQLGPDYRFVTPVSGTAAVQPGGILPGDLVVTGSGDPTLTTNALRRLARRLHGKGVRKVTGRLVVDDTRYGHSMATPGWKPDFVPDETPPVDAFTVDRNGLHASRSYLADPTRGNAARWRAVLKKAGVRVTGPTVVSRAPSGLTPLVMRRSPTLASLVDSMLTDSDNFLAESLAREAGAVRSGHGTRATAVAAIRAEARALGVPVGTVEDGSGLSYDDRETPRTLVRWLAAIAASPVYGDLYAGLPISCRTGTLEHRLCGASVRNRVHAKTGTLDRVSALSGYLVTRDGEPVTFSFLLSGIHDTTAALKHLDAAIGVIARS